MHPFCQVLGAQPVLIRGLLRADPVLKPSIDTFKRKVHPSMCDAHPLMSDASPDLVLHLVPQLSLLLQLWDLVGTDGAAGRYCVGDGPHSLRGPL